jgi:hypothetical protein
MPEQKAPMSMEQIMAAYKELAEPGEPHKRLASTQGSWSTVSRIWVDPDKPPVESRGSSERKMVLGGRYLQEEVTGDMMGTHFSGIGFIGFDNAIKKYVMVWMDSTSSGIYSFEGEASADGKTVTMESSYDDPIRGMTQDRFVMRFIDENTQELEMFSTYASGRRQRTQVTYTRKPAGKVREELEKVGAVFRER